MTTANDYGASALQLETLRRLVEVRDVAGVRFGAWTPSGAANGEYAFRLPGGMSAWVRSPTGPKGGPRHEHPGRWLFRLTHRPGRRLATRPHGLRRRGLAARPGRHPGDRPMMRPAAGCAGRAAASTLARSSLAARWARSVTSSAAYAAASRVDNGGAP